MIDIVIPTMWAAHIFQEALEIYVKHERISRIFIVDNNKKARPKLEILQHPKIELISYGRNIYVNPAWNEGFSRSKSNILGLLNDDIKVSPEVFDMIIDFEIQEGDLIGVNLQGRQNNFKIDDYINTEEKIVKMNYDKTKAVGSQAWAFGICMFMLRKSYRPIPSLYQIWYGDDYLAQRAKNIYSICSNNIKGTISETIVKLKGPNSDISKRIALDSRNFISYGHFTNGKNWDLPNQIVNSHNY